MICFNLPLSSCYKEEVRLHNGCGADFMRGRYKVQTCSNLAQLYFNWFKQLIFPSCSDKLAS